jgi:hypothetical protein
VPRRIREGKSAEIRSGMGRWVRGGGRGTILILRASPLKTSEAGKRYFFHPGL